MSRKALKQNSYRLKEQTEAKNGKLVELHTVDYPKKHEDGLENFSFVEKCSEKAQQKKIMENAIKCSKNSKDFSCSSMLIKFQIFMFLKMFNRLYCCSF